MSTDSEAAIVKALSDIETAKRRAWISRPPMKPFASRSALLELVRC